MTDDINYNLINEFKNDFPDKEPPILWDFSLINDITTEKLPENNIENMIWLLITVLVSMFLTSQKHIELCIACVNRVASWLSHRLFGEATDTSIMTSHFSKVSRQLTVTELFLTHM